MVGNSLFLDPHGIPYADQWRFLSTLGRIDRATAERIIDARENHGGVLGIRLVTTDAEAGAAAEFSFKSAQQPVACGEFPIPKSVKLVLTNQIQIEKYRIHTLHCGSPMENKFFERFAISCTHWAERWFPDPWVLAAVTIVVVALASLTIGAPPIDTAVAFGNGFWSLIPFTMQIAFVVIGGYVVASSPPAMWLIEKIARVPGNGRTAVCFVALISMGSSLLNWGFSMVFSGLLVRALARRTDLTMDYRAAGAAAYLGLGSVWALGISSSPAQMQANPASLPPALLATVAGTALLGSMASAMGAALAGDQDRLAAAGTLAVTVSGVTLMGVGSAFWGLVFGLLILGIDRFTKR